MPSLLARSLDRFDLHVLALVSDALTFVGLRLADSPDFRSKFTDLLFVTPSHQNMCRIRATDIQSFRKRHLHLVGVADAELQFVILNRCDVADTDDL